MAKIMTKADLIQTLKHTHQRVTDWFMQIPADTFFTRQADAWSASDNMDHLIKSHKPLSKGLKLPGLGLQTMFGKSARASRSYEEICQIYRDELAKGAQASGRYLPDQQSPASAEQKKKEILEEWSKASAELISAAEKWEDGDLDSYQLPHPILGNLTVREMLYFTIYHNLRHASQQGD